MYHYVLTREYPYTVGCFRGTPVRVQARLGGDTGGPPTGGPPSGGGGGPPSGGGLQPGNGPPSGRGPGGPRQPPAEALAACAGRSSGFQCRFSDTFLIVSPGITIRDRLRVLLPAINNHGGFGRWAFIQVADPWDAQNAIRKGISAC